MNKQGSSKTRYYIQWGTHAKHMSTVLCSLMEHQSLVDVAICCGTNTIHAHKCILASNSPYFREQLEKNAGTEQIIITGIDFAVIKSIIEFMYCGETNILDENIKYMVAAAKFFQMRGLQTLVSDQQNSQYETDSIHIPPPIFLTKKPKYPNTYRPVTSIPSQTNFVPLKSTIQNDPYLHRKSKRKFVRSEAEKACAKEAAASRLALEALQKELSSATQVSSFVIEESCTETTVENFIPHTEDTYIENLNQIEVPLQVINYNDMNSSLLNNNQMLTINKSENVNNLMSYELHSDPTKDKLKQLLGTDITGNVEIMFKTSEGNFVNVTDDVLQNLSSGTLQYQIMDENGQVSEIRELQVQDQCQDTRHMSSLETTLSSMNQVHPIQTGTSEFTTCPGLSLPSLQGDDPIEPNAIVNNNLNNVNKGNNQSKHEDSMIISTQEDGNEFINIISSSSNSSLEKNSNSSTPTDIKYEETFIEALHKSETANSLNEDIMFDHCDMNEFLNLVPPDSTKESHKNFITIHDPYNTNVMVDLEPNNILTDTSDCLEQNIENDQLLTKRSKITEDWQILENTQNTCLFSPRKTRSGSSLKLTDNMFDLAATEPTEIIGDGKLNISHKIISNRKRKSD